MSIFDAIVQGIIQGLTEFLPVSSSGHLSVYQHFSHNSGEAAGIYSVLLHMGTLGAVLIAFRQELCAMLKELFALPKLLWNEHGKAKKPSPARRRIFLLAISLLPLSTAYFAADFYNYLAADDDITVEGLCFLATAGLLWLSGKCVKANGRTAADMTVKDALAIGVMQSIAPLPGLSRSGSTIAAGLIMGVSRDEAVAFSFIMGIPAVLGANLLELPKALSGKVPIEWGAALLGMAVSLLTGLASIKTVKTLVKNDKFTYFAWYLAFIGLFVLGIGVCEHMVGAPLSLW